MTTADTGRDESGYLHIGWLRRDVRKANLTYKAMTGAELNWLMNLMQGKEFQFTFLEDNAAYTMNGYVGECSYDHYNYGMNGPIYTDISINVIEM